MAKALGLSEEEKNSPSLKKRLEKYLTLCLEAGYSDSNVRHATFDWWHCEMSVSSFSTPYLWWTRAGDWFTSSHLPCTCACITWIQHESCDRSVGPQVQLLSFSWKHATDNVFRSSKKPVNSCLKDFYYHQILAAFLQMTWITVQEVAKCLKCPYFPVKMS